ncbi:fumarylacetoacetate hydrolase family protein [Thalassospira xiamenensis]|uniref:fumarylacetoacetate hydrolase family protein n=1 Tax=Thalassospira xiamenensis TaxID=220697 RepID=UPI003AA85B33
MSVYQNILPNDSDRALLVTRVWRPELNGPSVAVLRDNILVDITNPETPTVSALMERDDCADLVRAAQGENIGTISEIAGNSRSCKTDDKPRFLAPCDLQVIKACGVTFAQSMLERVIEERANGDPNQAASIRRKLVEIVGDNLNNVIAGSEKANQIKKELVRDGLWSQYLEVGIGPDAEVFTKAPVLSSVGWGAEVGLHPNSIWSNPEPEVVLCVNSKGQIKGATLGNDVNLRDIEGRSALLLGKAKDNNASCAIGPFIRLFDEHYDLDDVRTAELDLKIEGVDGFELSGQSSMREISRDPIDLVSQTFGDHHQYPDGFMLFLGTLFAPSQDRDTPGMGFTHKIGDTVQISNPKLGLLKNGVQFSTKCPKWHFGIRALFANLAKRDLLKSVA